MPREGTRDRYLIMPLPHGSKLQTGCSPLRLSSSSRARFGRPRAVLKVILVVQWTRSTHKLCVQVNGAYAILTFPTAAWWRISLIKY